MKTYPPKLPLRTQGTQILDDDNTPLATALNDEVADWFCQTVNLIGGLPDEPEEEQFDEDWS
jgi:hypothetical protein